MFIILTMDQMAPLNLCLVFMTPDSAIIIPISSSSRQMRAPLYTISSAPNSRQIRDQLLKKVGHPASKEPHIFLRI